MWLLERLQHLFSKGTPPPRLSVLNPLSPRLLATSHLFAVSQAFACSGYFRKKESHVTIAGILPCVCFRIIPVVAWVGTGFLLWTNTSLYVAVTSSTGRPLGHSHFFLSTAVNMLYFLSMILCRHMFSLLLGTSLGGHCWAVGDGNPVVSLFRDSWTFPRGLLIYPPHRQRTRVLILSPSCLLSPPQLLADVLMTAIMVWFRFDCLWWCGKLPMPYLETCPISVSF